ncbi:hypothetical protein GCM10010222_12080 [Streptomyces tanashiensis]|nr:hypothetical protein GCM10010222_12080 [Streptomyces tanashiensis]
MCVLTIWILPQRRQWCGGRFECSADPVKASPWLLRSTFHGAGPVVGPGSGVVNKGLFRLLSLQAADRYWELAVPAADVALVRAALRGDDSGR